MCAYRVYEFIHYQEQFDVTMDVFEILQQNLSEIHYHLGFACLGDDQKDVALQNFSESERIASQVKSKTFDC